MVYIRNDVSKLSRLVLFVGVIIVSNDVIASLLLHKASKIELVGSYKAFLIIHTECILCATASVTLLLRLVGLSSN